MQKMVSFVLLALLLFGAAGCAPAAASPAGAALANYLQALVSKDEQKMTSLVCPGWQSDALIELDAFQAVDTKLEGLSCRSSGKEGQAELFTCQGKILAKYQDKTQEFDLSNRVYRVENSATGWQVCGYTVK